MKEKQIRVIVACEESQAVCSAFRKIEKAFNEIIEKRRKRKEKR